MPLKIDWYYRRNSCESCAKSDRLLDDLGAEIAEAVDARKHRIGPAEAVRLARAASHVWVMKGRKLVHVDIGKDQTTDEELRKLIVGPSGNLRAPTVRRGKQLFVGFSPDAFEGALTD